MDCSIGRDGRARRGAPAAATVVLVLVLLLLTACKRGEAAKAAPGDGGATYARVVSISPSTTEALFAVGAGAQVVGRSRFCTTPREAQALPQVGGYVDPSFEAILALRPDLVVGERGPVGPRIAERLAERGVATYFPATGSLSDIEAMVRGLGERTGHAAEADAVVARGRARVADVERATAGRPRVRVLLVFGLDPLVVAGPASFASEMLARAGASNVIEEGGAYPTLGVERVLALDPDVIVNASMGEGASDVRLGPDTPGWGKVRAVATGKVIPMHDDGLFRPGPRVAEGIAALARALHPDAPVPAPEAP